MDVACVCGQLWCMADSERPTSGEARDAIELRRAAVRDQVPTLRGLDLEAHLADPARKQEFVTPMFDIIASRYDDFTRVFSFGMDRAWKAELLDAVRDRVRDDAVAIDIACGTGDLAFAVAALTPRGRVTGVDASTQMIAALAPFKPDAR